MIDTKTKPLYSRVLLKLSGEALMGDGEFGYDSDILARIGEELKAVHSMGVEICLVVGGGNIYRGKSAAERGMERASADYVGMLATVMNALVLQNSLEKIGLDTRVLSAIPMQTVCEPFVRRRAVRHMERMRIVICAAGTGNPFFTTDTAAALRAAELGCQALLKATQVDGVYTADPKKDKEATHYKRVSYLDVITQNLKVMDTSAIALCRENQIDVVVFSIHTPGALAEVLCGRGKYTVVTDKD